MSRKLSNTGLSIMQSDTKTSTDQKENLSQQMLRFQG